MQVGLFTPCLFVYVFGVGVQGIYVAARDDLTKGYYWREYIRDIPPDALPGGMDRRGKTTYIGQTLHTGCENGVIVTGQIREAEQKMTYEWGYKQNLATEHVQILCAAHPEQFRWIETNPTDIVNLTSLHLVSGGVEKDYNVYIGRVITDGEIAIGKVLVTDKPAFKGLYTTMNGTYLHVLTTFEVLAYDANAPLKVEIPQASKLRSPNSSVRSEVWYPIFVVVFLRTLIAS